MILATRKESWSHTGVAIFSDGWSDPQRRPLINFMAIEDYGPVFLKAVNCEGEYKDKFFIANLIKEVILEVGQKNVVHVITDNAPVCKAAGMLVEAQFPHIFWTPCVVHTLNLALQNICAAKNLERNETTYEACHWITEVAGEALTIKIFITGHSMTNDIYNKFVSLKLLSVVDTRFASTLIMLKRMKLVKRGLQAMVISDEWTCYRDDNLGKALIVKELILNDLWWDKVDYILSFTSPIYDMLRASDTDKPTLHLMYDMWDTMIENVKKAIFKYEGLQSDYFSGFYEIVYAILVERWNKSNTPLHCLAHSLNPRYYSQEWLDGAPNHVAPHRDEEISEERNNCLRSYFSNNENRRRVNSENAKLSGCLDKFSNPFSLKNRASSDPKEWWCTYGSSAPLLQGFALKLLGQPSSSSCCERNWSTYSFIYSMKRNKIQLQRVEDLVFVHSNLRLVSRKEEYYNTGDHKMWVIGGDVFAPLDGVGELDISTLSLDELEIESVLF